MCSEVLDLFVVLLNWYSPRGAVAMGSSTGARAESHPERERRHERRERRTSYLKCQSAQTHIAAMETRPTDRRTEPDNGIRLVTSFFILCAAVGELTVSLLGFYRLGCTFRGNGEKLHWPC